jgi:hypothetical protein
LRYSSAMWNFCGVDSACRRTPSSSAWTIRRGRAKVARHARSRCRRSCSMSCRGSARARHPASWCSRDRAAGTCRGRSQRAGGSPRLSSGQAYKRSPDLRHTCASLAVSAGVNVLALQRMLGHISAAITLDTYSDLFDDDLDAVAVTLHTAGTRRSLLFRRQRRGGEAHGRPNRMLHRDRSQSGDQYRPDGARTLRRWSCARAVLTGGRSKHKNTRSLT